MKIILYPLILLSFVNKNFAQTCNAIELLNADYAVQADAIVCSETTELQFSNKNNVVVTKRKSVIVLNDAGRRHGHTVIFYDKNQKIKKASARFYNRFGKETKKISFDGMKNFGNEQMKTLVTRCKKLEELSLRDTSITLTSVIPDIVENCFNLVKLDLSSSLNDLHDFANEQKLVRKGVLRAMPKLKKFVLYNM